ncbi:unnamed protein product, partial [Darwinula stevensoni]
MANKLPEDQRNKVTNIGLLLAMVQLGLSEPFYKVDFSWMHLELSWQALILFFGGLFLIYKSTSEIREKVETPSHDEDE